MGFEGGRRTVNIVFADAGYWVALRNRRDVCHSKAIEIAQKLIGERSRILTTSFVFAEVYAIFSRMQNVREQVVRDFWENPIVQLEQATYEDQTGALLLLKEHADKSFSFADALSFVIMNRWAVRRAVSFDGHFKQYGRFELIDAV